MPENEAAQWTESEAFDNLSEQILQKALFMAAKNAAKSRKSATKTSPRDGKQAGTSAKIQTDTEDKQARFVLDESGMIIHATRAFAAMICASN